MNSLFYCQMVNTVTKALKILDLLAEGTPLGVTEISKILEIPKSSAHSILKTLEAQGVVAKSIEGTKFLLGIKLIELGNRAQLELDICKITNPYLKRLNAETDETVHLTVLDNDEVLYLDCIESTQRLRTYPVIGIRAPLHCTSVGKAILAFQEEDVIKRIVEEKGLPKKTDNTITTKKRLWKEIEKIRSLGYAIDDMEHEEHLRCVGAPIRNQHGEVFASISISGPTQRNTDQKIHQFAPLLISATDDISRKLGYRNNS